MTSIANCSRFSIQRDISAVADCGLRIADLNSAVISDRNDCARRCRFCCALHGSGNLSRVAQGDSADGRSAATKKDAERASLFSGRDDARQKRNQLRAKWLMKLIGKCAAQFFVVTRSK